MMSMLDGFSRYNWVLVAEANHHEMNFTTLWGRFAYKRMPFRMMNTRATFQRLVDFAFNELIGKSIEIYLDDLIVFSKERVSHIEHLRIIFERCRIFNISLNPKKSRLGLTEETILGHIIIKEGASIDLERVKEI